MADHVTKQVIDQIVTVLLAGSTIAGDRIQAGRVTPWPTTQLPAINVDGGAEEIILSSIHSPAIEERTASIDVVCIVRAHDEYDADAYTLLKSVEHLVAANPTMSGKAKNIVPSAIQWERDSSADVPIVRVTLTLSASLVVFNNAVDVPV